MKDSPTFIIGLLVGIYVMGIVWLIFELRRLEQLDKLLMKLHEDFLMEARKENVLHEAVLARLDEEGPKA